MKVLITYILAEYPPLSGVALVTRDRAASKTALTARGGYRTEDYKSFLFITYYVGW